MNNDPASKSSPNRNSTNLCQARDTGSSSGKLWLSIMFDCSEEFWGGRNLRGRVIFYLLARNGGLLGYGRRGTVAGGSVVVWSGRPAFPTNGDLRRLQVFQRLKQTLCATGTANSAHHVRDAIITIQDVLQPCSFRLAQRTTRKGRIQRGDG